MRREADQRRSHGVEVLAFLLFMVWCLLAGCSHPVNAAGVRCQLAALEELPDEPEDVTLGDVVQVVEHVKRCRKVGADAGAR